MFNNPLPKLLAKFSNKPWDWKYLAKNPNITSHMIENYLIETKPENVQWHEISQSKKLTFELVEDFQDNLDWEMVSLHYKVNPEFIDKFCERLDWALLLTNRHFTKSPSFSDIVVKYSHKISKLDVEDWREISENTSYTLRFIDLFRHRIDFVGFLLNPTKTIDVIEYFFQGKPLSEYPFNSEYIMYLTRDFDEHIEFEREISLETYRKFRDYLDWELLSGSNLPLEVIELVKNKLIWRIVSKNFKNLKALIEKFPDYIDWETVVKNKNFTIDLVEKYQNNLDWGLLSEKTWFLNELVETFPDKVKWERLSLNHNLTWDFIVKYFDRLTLYIHCLRNRMSLEDFEKNHHLVDRIFEAEIGSGSQFQGIFKFRYLDVKGSLQFLAKYKNHETWLKSFFNIKFHPHQLDRLLDSILGELNWRLISASPEISLRHIEGYEKWINWKTISYNPYIPLEIYEKYPERIHWSALSANHFNYYSMILTRNKKIYAQQLLAEITKFFDQNYRRQYETVLDMLKLRIRDLEMGLRESMI